MRIARLLLYISAFLAGSAGLSQVQALPAQPVQLGYSMYHPSGTPKAPTDKSPSKRQAEARSADAFEQGCNAGDISACADLGVAFELGMGREQNRPIAAVLFRQVCDVGFGDGCAGLARLYAIASDPSIKSQAAALREKACSLGSATGCTQLANILKTGGVGVEQDSVRAEALLRQTCAARYSEGCRSLGKILLPWERGDASRGEALDLLDRECKAGNIEACRDLLGIYSMRAPHPRRPQRVVTLYDACLAEDVFACDELGDRAATGDGLAQDTAFAQAVFDRVCAIKDSRCEKSQTLKKAPSLKQKCEEGDIATCVEIALLHRLQLPVLINDATAESYLVEGCLAGQPQACYPAFAMIGSGPAIAPARQQQAHRILERGCELEDIASCETLVQRLRAGDPTASDAARADQITGSLCEFGSRRACEELEGKQARGLDVPLPTVDMRYRPPIDPDLPEAEQLYERAAQPEDTEEYCAASTLKFRGATYSDTVCKSRKAILKGYELRPGQAPWQALLSRPDKIGDTPVSAADRVLCGGTLIKEGWILTAAHCLKDDRRNIQSYPGYTVRLGVFNPRRNEGISYPILRVFAHPSYRRSDLRYDIALIKYDTRKGKVGTELNSIARISLDPMSVSKRRVEAGMPVYTYGWGWTEASNSSSSAVLKGAKIRLVSQEECTQISGFDSDLTRNSALCASARDGSQACSGDSGGPLIYYGDADRRPKVIGVVSFGYECGTQGKPSFYTRVARARAWIDDTMKANR